MKKQLIISSCDECNKYNSFSCVCEHSETKYKWVKFSNTIPVWCPLSQALQQPAASDDSSVEDSDYWADNEMIGYNGEYDF